MQLYGFSLYRYRFPFASDYKDTCYALFKCPKATTEVGGGILPQRQPKFIALLEHRASMNTPKIPLQDTGAIRLV